MPGPAPGVWWRKSDGWWCSTIKGRQVRLIKAPKDKGKTRALEELRKKLVKPAATAASHTAVAEILAEYLTFVEGSKTPTRIATVTRALKSFAQAYGELSLAALGPEHAQAWIDGHPEWSNSTKTMNVRIVRAAFNWAIELRKADRQPLGKIHGPGFERREVLPSEADIAKLLACRNSAYRDFVTALVNAGCRPSEISRVTAADVNLKRKCWTLTKHKTAGKKQRARVVWLNRPMLALTKRLMKARPSGALFRNSHGGKPWNAHSVVEMFLRLRDEVKPSAPVTAYSLRHYYVTRALTSGVDVTTVAEMTGTSPQMIWKHYAHLLSNPRHMLEAVEKAGRR